MEADEFIPWERFPGEPNEAWHYFTVFRDLGPTRTLQEASKKLQKHRAHLGKLCGTHNWRPRAEAWDAHLDRLRCQEFQKLQQTTAGEHLKAAAALRKKAVAAIAEIDTSVFIEDPGALARWLSVAVKIEQQTLGIPDMQQMAEKLNAPAEQIFFDKLSPHQLMEYGRLALEALESQQRREQISDGNKSDKSGDGEP